MLDFKNPKEMESALKTSGMLAWVFAAAVLFYFLAAYVIGKFDLTLPEFNLEKNIKDFICLAIFALTLLEIPVILAIRKRRDDLLKTENPPASQYLAFSIVLYALSEIPALAGLLLYVLLKELSFLATLTLFSWFYLWLSRPRSRIGE